MHVRSRNCKTRRFMYWEGNHVPIDIFPLFLRFSLLLPQFQLIFLICAAVANSFVLHHPLKAMSLVAILTYQDLPS